MKPRPSLSGSESWVGVREDVTEEEQTQLDGLAAVGSRLAKVREQQQRTVESVASDLHLRLEVVRAIENGDEAQLPAATFLRGYVKAYARLLEIDDAALVARLPATAENNPEPLKRVGMRRRRTGISLPAGKWFIWSLVLAGLVFLVVFGAPVLERLWTSTGSSEVASDQLQLPQAESGEENESGLLALPETPLPIERGLVEQEAVEQEAVEQEAVEQEAVEQEAVEQETVVTTGQESVVQPAAEQTAVEKPLEPEPVTQETAGPALIQMRFSEDSWVEMEAHGRKLVVGTQYAGSERTVRAEPPILILLGNAPGVELVYRGEVVDITPYQRGKVARLTLED